MDIQQFIISDWLYRYYSQWKSIVAQWFHLMSGCVTKSCGCYFSNLYLTIYKVLARRFGWFVVYLFIYQKIVEFVPTQRDFVNLLRQSSWCTVSYCSKYHRLHRRPRIRSQEFGSFIYCSEVMELCLNGE